jgi:tRNA G10  N-methylase Trm11
MGHGVYGTDLADKMIEFSTANLSWLEQSHHLTVTRSLHQGDAMTTTWQQPIDAVVAETYLGQPFSAPPSSSKLAEVRRNCDHIISTFLKNIASQLTPGTPLCVAVPAWKDANGTFTHLSLTGKLSELGYERVAFKNVSAADLLYYREDQIVARELLVLVKK